jgi:predicted RNA-binding protein with PIN domain
MNKIIVDGYNVIFTIPALHGLVEQSLEEARDRLLRSIQSYLIRRRVQITVIFDGTQPEFSGPQPRFSSRLTVLFSRSPFKADPMIKELIRREGRSNASSVVTLDNDILQFARNHGIASLSPQEFFDRISIRPESQQLSEKHDPKIDDDELNDWLRLFNESGDD